MTTTVIKTQERTRKRLRTNTSEIVFKELYQEKTTNDEQEDVAIVPPTEISFDKKHQSILLITHFKDPLKVQSRYPIPELQPYEILVNNKAIGLNPIDWKGKKYGFGIYHFPWINGRESSGDVVKLGDQVDKFSIGDKVIVSSTSYRDNRTSTFQQYTAIDSRLVWKLPESFSYEDGATIGVGLVTAGIILYNSFEFELSATPTKQTTTASNNNTILIWGGATVVGLYVAQLAKIYGLNVIAVASTKHETYLKQLGVDHLIDRHLSEDEIINEINSIDGIESIEYGVDCVGKETSKTVLKILDLKSQPQQKSKDEQIVKPKFSGIVGVPKEYPESVDVRNVVIKRFHEDVSFGEKFIDVTSELLNKKVIEPVRFKQYKGGLHIIDNALKDLEKIGANGEKYVVSV